MIVPCAGQGAAFDSLRKELLKAPEDTGRVNLLLQMTGGDICNDPRLVRDYLQEAILLAAKLNWQRGIARTRLREGSYLSSIRQYDSALSALRTSEQAASKLGDKKLLGNIHDVYARAYEGLARPTDAIRHMHLAVDYYAGVSVMDELGTLGNLGILYASINDIPHALHYYNLAYRRQMEMGLKDRDSRLGMMLLVLKMGDLYLSIEQYDKARAFYDSVLVLNKDLKTTILDGLALKGIADVYYQQNNFPASIEYYLKSRDRLSEEETYYKIADELSLARAYNKAGDHARAQEYALGGLEQSKKYGFDDYLSPAYYALGQISASLKDYRSAIKHFDSSMKFAVEQGSMDYQLDTWEALHQTYEKMGMTGKAYEAYKHFVELKESIRMRQDQNSVLKQELENEFRTRQLADSVSTAKARAEMSARIAKQRTYLGAGVIIISLLLLLSFLAYRNSRQQKKANAIINEEKNKSEELLLNILPGEVAEELKSSGSVQARAFDEVTVLFTDFVNFTTAGENLTAQELVGELHECFKAFDDIIGRYHIEKIKTVGDAYLAVCGLPLADPDHAMNVVNAAREIRDYMLRRRLETAGKGFEVRIGIHSGNVIAGIVGIRKFAYDIWGDTVNTAARMEQHSESGKINISDVTYQIVKDKVKCSFRGELAVKNKGVMKMYFVES